MNQIATGYKPEFTLGGWFAGENAAMAEDQNREDLLKSQLANLLTTGKMPNDLAVSELEGLRAKQMSTPDMLDWYSKGYAGQMKSQDAAGNKAQELYKNDVATARAKLLADAAKYGLEKGGIDYQQSRVDAARGGGQMGFNMAPQAQASPLEQPPTAPPPGALKSESVLRNFMGNDPAFGYRDYDIGLIEQELAKTKDPAARAVLEQELEKARAALSGGQSQSQSASLLNKFSSSGGQPNQWLAGIQPDPVMAAYAMTPELYGKMIAGGEKAEDAYTLQERRLAAASERARLQYEKKASDPKYKEQLANAFKVMANPNATPQEKHEAELFVHLDKQSRLAANPGAFNNQIDVGAYNVPMRPSPVQQSQAPTPPTKDGKARKPLGEF